MKKKTMFLVSLALVVVMMLTMLPVSAFGRSQIGATRSGLTGDVNGDGSVTASDALMALRHAMNLIQLNAEQIARGDCDGDGDVDVDDALTILRYCLGISIPDPTPVIDGPTIIVDDATAAAGENVTVTVRVENNPGVAGAKLLLTYDSGLTLIGEQSGPAFSSLDYTRPAYYTSPCYFNWDSMTGMATEDGVILTLTFTVSNSVSQGDVLNVSISYSQGDIYDEDTEDVDFDIINGAVTIGQSTSTDPTPVIDGPTIIVDDATAAAGENVTVTVRVENNPGVAGAKLLLTYDSGLTLIGEESGAAFSSLDYTKPAYYTSPCYFNWDSMTGMATEDGVILTLTFTVSSTAAPGSVFNVLISYSHGDIYDEATDDVDFDIINGTVTIS